MTPILDDSNGKIDNGVLATILEDFNSSLEDVGVVQAITYNLNTNKFKIVFQDVNDSIYFIEILNNNSSVYPAIIKNNITTEEKAAELAKSEYVTQDNYAQYMESITEIGEHQINGANKLEIGMRVETGVTQINGVNLGDYTEYGGDNWKVFYADNNNVYLIFGDFYPSKALQNIDGTNLTIDNYWDNEYMLYVPWSSESTGLAKRQILLNYLTVSGNFSAIKNSLTESGKTFAGKNLIVTGSPSIEMWIDSWNKWHEENAGESETLGYKEVSVGDTFINASGGTDTAYVEGIVLTTDKNSNPVKYNCELAYESKIIDADGFSAGDTTLDKFEDYTDNLYFPRVNRKSGEAFLMYEDLYGYWLASKGSSTSKYYYSYDESNVLVIDHYGVIRGMDANSGDYDRKFCVRPIIQISISDFESATGIDVD